MMDEKIYGIAERNEHGRVVIRLLQPSLLPGTMVEVKPIDEAPTPDAPIPYWITPEGRALISA